MRKKFPAVVTEAGSEGGRKKTGGNIKEWDLLPKWQEGILRKVRPKENGNGTGGVFYALPQGGGTKWVTQKARRTKPHDYFVQNQRTEEGWD